MASYAAVCLNQGYVIIVVAIARKMPILNRKRRQSNDGFGRSKCKTVFFNLLIGTAAMARSRSIFYSFNDSDATSGAANGMI